MRVTDVVGVGSAVVDVLEAVKHWLLTDALRILVILALALVIRALLVRAINRIVMSVTAKSRARLAEVGRVGRASATANVLEEERNAQRMQTLGSLLRSIITFVVFGIATVTIMGLLGIPLGPLLTSAGIGGVALGFGAQTLVRDFLSGVFMIVEDQYGVGDVIDTGEAVGTVKEVSLRVTRLVDGTGVTWYVRNGEIARIGNRSQGLATAIVDMPVSYRESAEHAISVIRSAVAGVAAEEEFAHRVIDDPRVVGVDSVVGATMTIRVVATCLPGSETEVERDLRERIKDALDAAGIQGPPVVPPTVAGTGL